VLELAELPPLLTPLFDDETEMDEEGGLRLLKEGEDVRDVEEVYLTGDDGLEWVDDVAE
jgi:hypothetical protein